jgi:hypothetical protein
MYKPILPLLFIKVCFPINIFGLTCYQCADDKGDNCGDTFSVNGSTIVEVNSTSEFCWVREYVAITSLFFYICLLFRN